MANEHEPTEQEIKQRIRTFKCSSQLDVNKTDWITFLQRFELDLTLQDLDGDNPIVQNARRNLLLKWIGAEHFKTVVDHFSPDPVLTKSYDAIVAFLGEWFCTTQGYLTERMKFRSEVRRLGQPISQFLNELRAKSARCKFGQAREEHIRDQFLFGINDPTMQEEILRRHPEGNDKLQDIVKTALLLENAHNQQKALGNAVTPTKPVIHKMSTSQTNKPGTTKRFQDPELENTLKRLDPKKHCLRCGNAKHDTRGKCPALHSTCNACKQTGHWKRACIKTGQATAIKTTSTRGTTNILGALPNQMTDEHHDPTVNLDNEKTTELEASQLFNQHNASTTVRPYLVMVQLNDRQHEMEVDSGAAYSIISMNTYQHLWPHKPPPLEDTNISLHLWNKEDVQIMGAIYVDVNFRSTQSEHMELLVAKHGDRSLIGRNWFQALGISINGISSLSHSFIDWKEKFPNLFSSTLGKVNGPPVSIELKENAKAVFQAPRTVPLPLKQRVEKALDDMVENGTLSPVQYSAWATPIVPVCKQDGTTRICIDYRSTVNAQLKPNAYPLPVIAELLTTLAEGTVFSKLDMAQAYLQLPVDEVSSEILAINTHRGLYKVHRLPFGLSASPGIFQRFMENVLAGIPGTAIYLDDIVVAGRDVDEHNSRLQKVLERMVQTGLRLKAEKCKFAAKQVQFVGFNIDAEGIHPTDDKIKAIKDAPEPRDKQELRAFLGMINFYGQFLRDKATVAEPLHRLLQEKVPWKFHQEEKQAFKKLKNLIQSSSVLTHYSLDKELILSCDASSYGLGAVLSHPDECGREKPIAFASRTLSAAERNYAQIDREGLAIIFGLQRFYRYVAGRKIRIVTDHKPLLGLFNPNKRLPQIISPRMLRWCLLLSNFSYELEYRPGTKLADADACSRLPIPSTTMDLPEPAEVLMLETDETPISAETVRQFTENDSVLCKLRRIIRGEVTKDRLKDDDLQPFASKFQELSIQQGCIIWGQRVVIPKLLRQRVLQELHATHPGIVAMKMIARGYAWWPRIDKDIEVMVHSCELCQTTRHLPPKITPTTWKPPEVPWSRIHVDTYGPVEGQLFLLVVDSFSKWLEVEPLQTSDSMSIIQKLRRLFATHGIPEVLVSDNASYFTSQEFSQFLQWNQIHHICTPLYHPASNGQAERFVQTAKTALKRIVVGDWNLRLQRYLIHQHADPSPSTGKSPSELLLGRKIRTVLDTIKPKQPAHQDKNKDGSSEPERAFEANTPVYVAYWIGKKQEWVPATIVQRLGRSVYEIQLEDGHRQRRHVDHIRRRYQ